MKLPFFLCSCLLAAVTSYAQPPSRIKAAPEQLFDENWRFLNGNPNGAEKPDFPDAKWRTVNLPHDWAIEDLPGQNDSTIIGPFNKYSPSAEQGGYVMGGTAWYRKSFTLLEPSYNLVISFEGVYMNSDVWLNGHFLGNHPYGYTPFSYDLSPFLAPAGKMNTIAVRVKNEGKNTRWYSGAGIYRHVHLQMLPPTHFISTAITTPLVSKDNATVQLVTTLTGPAPTTVIFRLLDAGNRIVAADTQQVKLKGDTTIITQILKVNTPSLWSPNQPYRYKAEVLLPAAQQSIPFGIRQIHADARNGLTINGERVRLKGACIHHDNGLLGAAAFDYAEVRKVALLKKYGFNAIRTSHNPPSPKFLDACDSLGMLVIDEAFDMWEDAKNPDDYHRFFHDWWQRDLQSMICRDRNHPSVIMWSIGNEIPERADSQGLILTKQLIATVRLYDSTRLITEAENPFWERNLKWEATDASFALLDVAGYNYQWGRYFGDEKRVPGRVMFGSETVPRELADAWTQVEGLRYVIGDFVWTAMDYLGEAGLGHSSYTPNSPQRLKFPWFNANCGDLDLIGDQKIQSKYRDVVWRRSAIEIAVHAPESGKEEVSYWGWPDEQASWTWPGCDGKKMLVRVFSRSNAVRLELNGKVIAAKYIRDGNFPFTTTFEVPYAPGVLEATAITDGKELGNVSLVTASKAVAIRLTTDRNAVSKDPGEVSYVHIDVMDAEGNVVPNADLPLQLSVSGAGTLAAAGNACPNRPASFQQPVCTTFRGKALAILRSNGEKGHIKLEVKSPGLKTGEISIKAD